MCCDFCVIVHSVFPFPAGADNLVYGAFRQFIFLLSLITLLKQPLSFNPAWTLLMSISAPSNLIFLKIQKMTTKPQPTARVTPPKILAIHLELCLIWTGLRTFKAFTQTWTSVTLRRWKGCHVNRGFTQVLKRSNCCTFVWMVIHQIIMRI